MMNNLEQIRFHEDKDLFREALEFTAASTGFPTRLIEKDYYCTILLKNLASIDSELIFKGGTCLAKVYSNFYRLSEDLDYSISMSIDASRGQRSRRVNGLKIALSNIEEELPGLRLVSPFIGANESTQYIASVEYPSVLISEPEVIKIEVGLREPILLEPHISKAHTLVLNPAKESDLVPGIDVKCLSWKEAMAEKLRAALTRREPAIRDFYDIYYAVSNIELSLEDPELIEIVEVKLKVPGNADMDLSNEKLESLHTQVTSELEPVLRQADFAAFDLDGIFTKLLVFADSI